MCVSQSVLCVCGTVAPPPVEMNMPGLSLPSRLVSPRASNVRGSSSTGRPASYSAYTLPPHAMMLVLAKFFWCKSKAFAQRKGARHARRSLLVDSRRKESFLFKLLSKQPNAVVVVVVVVVLESGQDSTEEFMRRGGVLVICT